MFINLGSDYLWADEGDTAVLASSILKFGVPKAWDGVTFTDSDEGARENDQLTMVSTPWMQYYVAAASLAVFGQNSFAARLPFAIAGWITVLLAYQLVRRISRDWRPAFCAAILIICSVQFLLYARQARYYALTEVLTCWLFLLFIDLNSARRCAAFSVVAILLFHSHPVAAAPLAAMGVLSFVHPSFFQQRRWLLMSAAPILTFTLPWFVIARTGYLWMSTAPADLNDLIARAIQYLLELGQVTSLIGIVLLLAALVLVRSSKPGTTCPGAIAEIEAMKSTRLSNDEKAFIVLVAASLVAYIVPIAATQQLDSLFVIGMRYTAAIIPLMGMVAAILILRLAAGRTLIWVPLLVIFCTGRLDQIGPWISWNPSGVFSIGRYSVMIHVSSSALNRFVDFGLLRFVCNLRRGNPGTMGRSAEILRRYAQPGDIVVTNYESEPLYFHTQLPQGFTIPARSPIYQTARQRGLPDYVFGVDHARWIVWRFSWDGTLGLTWAQVQQQLLAKGAKITEMTRLKETFWENRENVHFARFCGGVHLFGTHHQHHRFPRTRIFRIDYPHEP
jgi:hypothetical protein